MPITKWFLNKILPSAFVAVLAAFFTAMITKPELIKPIVIYGIAVLVIGFVFAALGDGIVRIVKVTSHQKIRSARIAWDVFNESIPISGERRVGIVFTNLEWSYDMYRFECWLSPINSKNNEAGIIESIRRSMSGLKSHNLMWRDSKENQINIPRRKGKQRLIIAESNSKRNTFSLMFTEQIISDIPIGTYAIGLGSKGRMKNRQGGLFAYAVEVKYDGSKELEIRPIGLEEANIHIA